MVGPANEAPAHFSFACQCVKLIPVTKTVIELTWSALNISKKMLCFSYWKQS
jgi:hypothetical protein